MTYHHAASRLVAGLVLGFLLPVSTAFSEPMTDIVNAIVRIDAEVPADARTARTLGTERRGSGVVIDETGLIVTIGYLIMEADTVTVTTAQGTESAAIIVGYDHASGFGLIRASEALKVRSLRLGKSAPLEKGTMVAVAGMAGQQIVQPAIVASRRPFGGYWEYLLENAIFTSPPLAEFGGAALINAEGRLLGIGSLFVGDAETEGEALPGNMFVPIDLLSPILADMLEHGRSQQPQSPWLGVYVQEVQGHVMIARLAENGPGAAVALEAGDIIVGVAGQPVTGMVDYLRKVKAAGSAGSPVALSVVHGSELRHVDVPSRDRHDWLKLQRSY